MAFPQADAIWSALPKKDGMYGWYGRGTKHGKPDGCSFSSLLGATQSSLSSHDLSTVSRPPSAGSQGGWVRARFCVQTQ